MIETNGWEEWKNHVLLELKYLRQAVDELRAGQSAPRACQVHRLELDALREMVHTQQKELEQLKSFRWQIIGAMIALQGAAALVSHFLPHS